MPFSGARPVARENAQRRLAKPREAKSAQKKTTQAARSPLPGELGAESRQCTGNQSNGKGHQVLVAWLTDAEPNLIFPARCSRGGARGSTGSGGSAAGDGAFLPPPELFILGETEEYFVSLTKQHFTGA